MTPTDPAAVEAMIEKLEAKDFYNLRDGIPTLVNPDGPEAAAMLRALASERDEHAERVRHMSHFHAESIMANAALGGWMSAALDDPKVCDAMKADIERWFSSGPPIAVENARERALAAEAEAARLREALRPFAEIDLTGHGLPHDFAINVLAARAVSKENHDGL